MRFFYSKKTQHGECVMIIPSLKQIDVDVVSVVPKMVVTERCKSYSLASGNEFCFTT